MLVINKATRVKNMWIFTITKQEVDFRITRVHPKKLGIKAPETKKKCVGDRKLKQITRMKKRE